MANASTPYSDGQIWDETDANWVAGFGDGTDGAFSESSGTTNLTQGQIYQYTTLLLDTSATISASSTSEKPIIIYVQGDCTINGTIDLVGKGCPTSFEGYSVTEILGFDVGTEIGFGTRGGLGPTTARRIGGIKGGTSWNFALNQMSNIMNGTAGGSGVGAGGNFLGGGGGASSQTNGSNGETFGSGSGSNGAGGTGGCTLNIICGGDLTFGASSTVDVSGNDGGDGAATGGGGGGSGDILMFYNGSLSDGGITTTKDGGAAGADTTDANSDGGIGAAGAEKIVAYDTIFWGK